MTKRKALIHFVPGSYGHFLEGLLNKTLKQRQDGRSDFHWINKTYTDIVFDKTHDMELKSNDFHLKVTFDENDLDLINRNKWIKWPEDFEPAMRNNFPNSDNIDEITKEIVTKAYFRSHLHKDMHSWNLKVNEQTVTVPFNFFISQEDYWITAASKIFELCQIDYSLDYIRESYYIFKDSQNTILTDHYENKSREWKDKDIIAKSNVISDLYYYRFLKDDRPIPPTYPPRYSNTSEMMAYWVEKLNHSNGSLENDV